MKTTICTLLAGALLASCSHLQDSADVGPEIRGAWAGEGRFLDRDLNAEYGTFPVVIEVHPDDSVTGTVGVAEVTDGVVKSRPEDFLIEAGLAGPVFPEGSLPRQHKDCVVFLLEPPVDRASTGNLHLKTNHAFDFSMRVCAVELTRQP